MTSIRALAVLMFHRARATPQLLAIRLAGLLVAVTLVAGVSLYSSAMGDAMLRQRLDTNPANTNIAVSLSGQSFSNTAYAALDSYIRHDEQTDLGLPLHNLRVHHNTTTLLVFRLGPRGAQLSHAPLASLALDYYPGVQDQVVMVAGAMNVPARLNDGDVPVFVSEYTSQSLNLHVGDRVAFSWNHTTALVPALVVAGVFVASNPASAFWDIHAGDPTYRSLITPNLDSFQTFAATLANVYSPQYFWLQQTNIAAIHLADAGSLLNRIDRVRSKVAGIAPGTTLITSLDEAINGFLDQYDLLPSILLILVTPIVILILYGVMVTTTLALDQQGAEIVLMRSRGATRAQVFNLYVGEGVVLGLIALLVGPFLGLLLADLISHSSGFLSFTGGLPFTLHLLPDTYLYSALTALLCLLAALLPAMGLSRRSMMSFKSEQARPRGRPLWQRLFLDFIILAVALYGLDLLIRQGPVTSGAATAAIAQDPLIAIAPLLFAVALTLFLSRILPWLAALGLHLLGRLSSPSAHVALQSVARAPRQPMRLVQLCTLTLTLGIVAATVAGVEASNLTDQYLYQAGAPLRLRETFDRQSAPANVKNTPDIMPLSAHLALPGVHAVTPALRYDSFGNVVNFTDNGTVVNVLGVDPTTAAQVMWYRPDFAGESFTRLLQSITTPGANAIVSPALLSATGLQLGDSFDVTLSNNTLLSVRVAAVARYFPSLDPSDYPFVVTNLTYLEQRSKSHGPNEVLLSINPTQATINNILAAIRDWPRQILSYDGLPPANAAQGNPLTAGIYGVVSVGFLIALGLALLGFIAYAYLTLRQRLSEVAILRALGLSQGQVRSLLLFEQVFLLGAAILGGIVAGVLTTVLFLPYLPIATNIVPPFLVITPWSAVGEFVLAVLIVFLLVLSVHVTLLLRAQLGRVLRLGEG